MKGDGTCNRQERLRVKVWHLISFLIVIENNLKNELAAASNILLLAIVIRHPVSNLVNVKRQRDKCRIKASKQIENTHAPLSNNSQYVSKFSATNFNISLFSLILYFVQ